VAFDIRYGSFYILSNVYEISITFARQTDFADSVGLAIARQPLHRPVLSPAEASRRAEFSHRAPRNTRFHTQMNYEQFAAGQGRLCDRSTKWLLVDDLKLICF
jgi:hypothetical protein